jgi:hypothetical protein
MTNQITLARIDRLILKAIEQGIGAFDDIFLYVGRNFSGARPPKFVDLAYRRLMKLKKEGMVSYDKSLKIWEIIADKCEEGSMFADQTSFSDASIFPS